jgi:hypothetical protein
VGRRVLRVHLPEAREPSAGPPFLKETKERSAPLDVAFEREFAARQKANRYCRLIHGSEAAGGGAGK